MRRITPSLLTILAAISGCIYRPPPVAQENPPVLKKECVETSRLNDDRLAAEFGNAVSEGMRKLVSADWRFSVEGSDDIKRLRANMVRELVAITEDQATRTARRHVVVLAIGLLGELRAEEAVEPLLGLLLYGRQRDLVPRDYLERIPDPENDSPAVAALVGIGTPSLEPVTEVVLGLEYGTKDMGWNSLRSAYCFHVIERVLGKDLELPYLKALVEKHEHAAGSRFITDRIRGIEDWRRRMGEQPWEPARSQR
ncbi:MAG: hypothetical protein ACYS9X_04340 [Planctomycetota bacterium]|jgi:hypothetical protein